MVPRETKQAKAAGMATTQANPSPSSPGSALFNRLRWAARFVIITSDILVSTALHCLFLLALKPLLCRLIGREDLYWRLEGFMFERILNHVAVWIHSAGYRVCRHGDEIPAAVLAGRTLVISNHVSTGDVPSLFYLWSAAGSQSPISRLWWVMDVLFKWTPFGWVSQVHRDHFIRQGKETRDGTIEQFARSVGEDYLRLPRRWCVIFPEGGFHRKRIAASNRFAEKNGLSPLDFVTYPRAGAVYAFASALASAAAAAGSDSGLDYIIDLTIGYSDNKPFGLDDIVFGWRQPATVHICQRVYSVAKDSVPVASSEDLLQWLYQRWQAKNAQLEEFYRTNEFPGTGHCRTELNWPLICLSYAIAGMHVFLFYRLVCLPFYIFG